MRVHIFQHEHFEKPFAIGDWAAAKGLELSYTHFYKETTLPDLNEIQWLVVMGGSMSVNEEEKFPWLKQEKAFIKKAIESDKVVIGICLGAQMIANVLGSQVYPNKVKEIGWYPVVWKSETQNYPAFKHLTGKTTVMHWHGETFDLPQGAVLLAESEACKNQAFICKNKVAGFQFHMEFNEAAITEMTENCSSDLTEGPFIQKEHELKEGKIYINNSTNQLFKILDALL